MSTSPATPATPDPRSPAPRLRRLARHAALRGRAAASADRARTDEAGQERCDLCAEPLPAGHRHLLDLRADSLSCACGACCLLFDRQRAGGAHYRLLPVRRLRLDGCAIDDALWAGLGIPVDLAFFTRGEESGEILARYPSPLGVMRSAVDPDGWRQVAAGHPALATMADDVEALLVNRAKGAREHWLVPLDDCYRMVAVVRAHWKGLGGGHEVWGHVETFFRELPADRPPRTEETSWASP